MSDKQLFHLQQSSVEDDPVVGLKEQQLPPGSVTPAEDLPAPFVNVFHISVNNETTRFGFGEVNMAGSGIIFPRAAITMTTESAENFAKKLLEIIAEHHRKNAVGAGSAS